MPSFLPRINPKEEVTTINKLGEMEAKDKLWNKVLCNKKHTVIIKNTANLRLIRTAPLMRRGLFLIQYYQHFLQMLEVHCRGYCPGISQVIGIALNRTDITYEDSL